MARRTAISAGWIVAFDGRGHRLLRDGVVVVEGEAIPQGAEVNDHGAQADGQIDPLIAQ